MMEVAIEAGAKDVVSDDDFHFVYTDIELFSEILEYLTNKFDIPYESELEWKSHNAILINDEEYEKDITYFIIYCNTCSKCK